MTTDTSIAIRRLRHLEYRLALVPSGGVIGLGILLGLSLGDFRLEAISWTGGVTPAAKLAAFLWRFGGVIPPLYAFAAGCAWPERFRAAMAPDARWLAAPRQAAR